MAEEITKVKIAPITAGKGTEGEDFLITYVGADQDANTKYGVVYPIPKNDEQAKERYDKTLPEMAYDAVRKFATGPNYQGLMRSVNGKDVSIWAKDGTLDAAGQKEIQTLADGYVPGRKSAGPTVKADATSMRSIKEVKSATGDAYNEDEIKAILAAHTKSESKKK
jgi:hypothetical protein